MIWRRSVQLAENKAHMDDLRPLNCSREAQVMETSRCPVSSQFASSDGLRECITC
ncbi:hypothetical protein B296_00040937 [Ensete ventricosum]|uniref:Uncharacterized protein n=1 Tax=Ensete ventricosum TaxID=4639 RepID=A0A426Z5N2_ENSVE|nr:hypothetical protein B296_00040937 [Ensete ventricosum]